MTSEENPAIIATLLPGCADTPASCGAVRVAVKDCIDVAGVVSTSGSALVAEAARPASSDAVVVDRLRSAGATVVAKTNLDELCFGSTGVNPWFGTPVNPLDATRIPGGSSSGSAVAVSTGLADVALGTDTTGSARTPAAFCGVVGLKLTHATVPMQGVRALAPTLDCLGILAADTPPIRWALEALGLVPESIAPSSITSAGTLHPPATAPRLARLRISGTAPQIEDEVDRTLEIARAAGRIEVTEVELAEWGEAAAATRTILLHEAPDALRPLVGDAIERLGPDVQQRFAMAADVDPDDVRAAMEFRSSWTERLRAALDGTSAIVTSATTTLAPRVDDRSPQPNAATSPVSLAGFPAIVGPARRAVHGGGVVAAMQLIGRPGSELELCSMLEAIGATTDNREHITP